MNRFLLIPNLRPEFKRVQPLPTLAGMPAAKGDPAVTAGAGVRLLKPEDPSRRPAATGTGAFTAAGRNAPS
ncbi:MAG: hypothetical protein KGJ60_14790 [Verrucomicrobiota bacterium]|nr:hypothetical protein [Verrucomicrobiota bacterium]